MTSHAKEILVTGAKGFIGSNLIEALQGKGGPAPLTYDVENTFAELELYLQRADVVYHLAGVNRPSDPAEFEHGNVDLTAKVVSLLEEIGRHPAIVFSSSIQADLPNDYGLSKKKAEEILASYADRTGAAVRIFRLPNAFGKWSRPNYNSVVSTYCHNIARDLPIRMSDPATELELVYIDDIVCAFLEEAKRDIDQRGVRYCTVTPTYRVTLARLADELHGFRAMRKSLMMPDLHDRFVRSLYATYVSYLDVHDFAYRLQPRSDTRGALAEVLKSQHVGQIFISRTKPGITRGNHYHNTKVEKFVVLEGNAIIRFRDIRSGEVHAYTINGNDFKVVDIPTGYTHSIENVGTGELIVLFWASEVFDPETPDTIPSQVLHG